MKVARKFPVGTKIISFVNEDRVGVVTSQSECRGMDQFTVLWPDGKESLTFNHEARNRIAKYSVSDHDAKTICENFKYITNSYSAFVVYDRPCACSDNVIQKCVVTNDGNSCIFCRDRITPIYDV